MPDARLKQNGLPFADAEHAKFRQIGQPSRLVLELRRANVHQTVAAEWRKQLVADHMALRPIETKRDRLQIEVADGIRPVSAAKLYPLTPPLPAGARRIRCVRGLVDHAAKRRECFCGEFFNR